MINVLKPLPKQNEFLELSGTHNLLVSGYGFGKTETKLFSLLMDMCMYGKYNPVFTVYDPTYDLLDLNTLPRILERLEQLNVKHKYIASKRVIETSLGKIILRSMDTPSRIVAYESFRSYIDELETLRKKQIVDVWAKIIARNRQVLIGCPEAKNRTYTFTTPDAGFGFTYEKWGKAVGKQKEIYQYVCASSRDNPYLPADYIASLEADYSDEHVSAFVDGHWTNLTSGVVYPEFNVKSCHGTIDVHSSDIIHIGQDFNVGGCVSIICKLSQGVLYVLKTIVTDKTYNIAERYFEQFRNKAIMYPDSSGKAGSSNATLTDIEVLRKDFKVIANDANPRISERVLSLNSALRKGLLKIDTNEPSNQPLINALNEQAYTQHGQPEKMTGSATIDDYNDALGYLYFKINPIRRPVANISSVIQTG